MKNIRADVKQYLARHGLSEDYILTGTGKKESASKGRFEFDCRNRTGIDKCTYVLKYFEKYDLVILWQSEKEKARKFSANAKDVFEHIHDMQAGKGVEYRWWKMTDYYFAQYKDLEKLLDLVLSR